MELLISMTILAAIMVVLLSITNSTQRIWKQTSQRIDSFRAARTGFEAMTRRLSQATLNTYWDYDNPRAPTTYIRRSELRFISGMQANSNKSLIYPLVADSYTTAVTGIAHPTHSVFFQAPVGYVSGTSSLVGIGMETLLNTCGYFIELASDNITPAGNYPNIARPGFLTTPPRTRFRLMELCQPGEKLNIYQWTSGLDSTNYLYGNAINPANLIAPYQWFLGKGTDSPTGLASDTSLEKNSHVLAENVIALILLPKLPATDDPTGLTLLQIIPPGSTYTSLFNSAPQYATVAAETAAYANQLPPLVQVTMVALDEPSAARLQLLATAQNQDQATFLGLTNTGTVLFGRPKSLTNVSPGYTADLNTLLKKLDNNHLNYRVLTSEVSIRAANWGQ